MTEFSEFLSKTKKILLVISWVLRGGAICCFLYGGALAAKDLGPVAWKNIKQAIKNDPMDPMNLHKMELQKARELEEAKAKAKSAMGDMAKEGYTYGMGETPENDPYKYIAGGKAARPAYSGADGAGDADGDADGDGVVNSQDADFAGSHKGSGKGPLDEAIQMASAGMGSGIGALGGAGADRAGAGARDLAGLRRTTAGPGASMEPPAGGLRASSGKMAGRGRHSVRQRRTGASTRGGSDATEDLKAAVNTARYGIQEAQKNPNVGSDYAAGGLDGSFAGRQQGSGLEVPGFASAIGGVSVGAALSSVGNKFAKAETPDIPTTSAQRSKSYDSQMMVLNVLALAISILGVVLAKLPRGDAISMTVWWALWAAGMAMLITMAGLIVDLSRQSDYAASLAQGYWGAFVPLLLGYGMLAAGIMTSIAEMTMVSSGIQSIIGFMQRGQGR